MITPRGVFLCIALSFASVFVIASCVLSPTKEQLCSHNHDAFLETVCPQK
jgi:hypothetical protein